MASTGTGRSRTHGATPWAAALALLALASAPGAEASPPPASGGHDFPVRGVVEGFYGEPWSWPAREAMVGFLGATGYTHYVYAPKRDRKHRGGLCTSWRDLYTQAELDGFRGCLGAAQQAGLRFVYGISPVTRAGESLDPAAGGAAWGLLLAKIDQLADLGVRDFMVGFDDMAMVATEAVGAQHARAAGGLLAHLEGRYGRGGAHVWLVPWQYFGVHSSAYLRGIAAALPPRVEVLWTGPSIWPATISRADAEAITAVLRRPPLVWDNSVSNDVPFHAWLKIQTAPVVGRDAELPRVGVRGFLVNGMHEPASTELAAAMFAPYLEDADAYDPEAALCRGARAFAGHYGARSLSADERQSVALGLEALSRFEWARAHRTRGLPGQPQPVEPLTLMRYRRAVFEVAREVDAGRGAGSLARYRGLRDLLRGIREAPELLLRLDHPGAAREWQRPAERLRGRLALWHPAVLRAMDRLAQHYGE